MMRAWLGVPAPSTGVGCPLVAWPEFRLGEGWEQKALVVWAITPYATLVIINMIINVF